ncbi:hypothetical protein FHS89_001801 [Rubricella aquisinus]|uniref:Uncharacterized protein n=1 Tax=Rubricella aquisinus TaxID=2028108 RepID=A0A840WMJ0_9RHOB|nr:hypothetical protein [Rubricella aquisinus]MBB5515781.1 hypothetical protein [Rubricella aquisinus]
MKTLIFTGILALGAMIASVASAHHADPLFFEATPAFDLSVDADLMIELDAKHAVAAIHAPKLTTPDTSLRLIDKGHTVPATVWRVSHPGGEPGLHWQIAQPDGIAFADVVPPDITH